MAMASSFVAFLHSITITGIAINQKNHIIPITMFTIVKIKFFSDLAGVVIRVLIIDELEIQFTFFRGGYF